MVLKGVKERAIGLGRTVIDLPEDAEHNLMWITLLDSASLSGKRGHYGQELYANLFSLE